MTNLLHLPRTVRERRRLVLAAAAALGLLASVSTLAVRADADTMDSSWHADGDTSGAQVTSALTNICLGQAATVNVRGAIHRNSNGADKKTFANSSTVRFELVVGSGSDAPWGLSLGTWTDTMPSNWTSQPLGTTRFSANLPASFTATSVGGGHLRLILKASGTAVDGGALELEHNVTPAGGGAFSWSAVDCSQPEDETPVVEENNVSLTLTTPSQSLNEGSSATNAGAASGTGGVTVTASSGTVVQGDDGTFTWSELEADGPNNSKTVTVTATNGKGKSVSETFTVEVLNVRPAITSGNLNLFPNEAVYQLGATVAVNGHFFDPAAPVIDLHTCTVEWDDGTSGNGTVSPSDVPTGECDASHAYTAAGVYTITMTVRDKDGGVSGTVTGMVVIYDPNAGFVTGGGWINAAPGSYTADPNLSGKSTFGFVAKYLPGRSVPSGNTEFQFHANKFNFSSTNYAYLVVSGCKAQYRGTGTVNGATGYSFYVVATDGNTAKCKSPGGVDKFRIKIWNASGVVFDNRLGASDDLDSANPQVIDNGDIVIHTR